jgi:hypothetical protein
MKIAKHLIKVLVSVSKRTFCKHKESYSASCPFTGKTYVNCSRCLRRMDVVDTV